MTTRERFLRMYAHREADRIPIIDQPWHSTIRRWQREGMPQDADWRDYFDLDKVAYLGADITPRYPAKTLEETDEYIIYTTGWGTTLKQFKTHNSTPEFLDFTVTTPEAWADAKQRMLKDAEDRIDWAYLKANYPRWVAEGQWIGAEFWFGFDVTHSWMAGTETLLIAMHEAPEWCVDMFNTYLDCCIRQFEKLWAAGYRFDEIYWPDDMGYKHTTFFSLPMYRQLLKPVHKRAIDWAHSRGIYAHLHSCGDVMTFVPDLVEIGVDALNPLEVKAGMEPLTLKAQFGDTLTLHGGVNAVLWDDKDAILAEIDRVVPALKQRGGYIFSSDHSIPESVSLENFRAIVAEVKRVGRY